MDSLIKSSKLVSYLKNFFPDLEFTEEAVSEALYCLIKINKSTFSNNLKQIRCSRKINQTELIKSIKTTQTTYSSWETAKHVPQIKYVKALSQQFDVDPYEFIKGMAPSVGSRSLPTLMGAFFVNAKYEDIPKMVDEYKASHCSYCIDVSGHPNADYGFWVKDDSMLRSYKGITENSYLICNSRCFQDMTKSERFEFANNKVCIVSVNGSDAFVRELYFDGEIVSLKSWNKDAKSTNKVHSPIRKDSNRYNVPLLELKLDEVELFAIVLLDIVDFS